MGKKQPPDMDRRMMAGCAAYVLVSLLAFFLSIWPFFTWPALWEARTVLTCSVAGFLPSGLVGLIAARKTGVAGASGYVAAAMAFAVFLYLRLDQVRLSALARQTPELDYGPSLGVWLPLGWVLLACLVGVVGLRSLE